MDVQDKEKKSIFPTRETVEEIRENYPYGTMVRLVKMNDFQAPPIGTAGVVVGVDDIGSLIMEWVDGNRLSVIHREDIVRKVDEHEESE
jgi:hypothetical protein